MELEWDQRKRQQAIVERGLDFADVARFVPESVVTIKDGRFDYGEDRFASTGDLDGVLCRFCWTPRNGRIRVISMGKVNERERKIYQNSRSKPSDIG